MSSNKIGFLSALGIYTTIILGLAWIDLKVKLVGEMDATQDFRAFSIKLENIAGDFGAQPQKAQKKVVKKVPKKSRPAPLLRSDSIESPKQIKPESSTDSKSDSSDSHESTADSSDSRGGISSIAQSSSGENDPYFLAITRIINKYHTREPVRNLYGVVGVAFSVNVSGEVEHLRVVSSSGSEKLDSVALRTIRRAARKFPPPKRTYHIQTRLVYKRN